MNKLRQKALIEYNKNDLIIYFYHKKIIIN